MAYIKTTSNGRRYVDIDGIVERRMALLRKDRMTNDDLELKLARLASCLVRDLDEVDSLTFERSAARQQKVQLAHEAFGEAFALLSRIKVPEPCKVPGCEVDHAGVSVPASLMDHGA